MLDATSAVHFVAETSPSSPPDETREMTWSKQRSKHRSADKHQMGRYYVAHDFLVPENVSPEADRREPVASILVNQGTTGDVVVHEVLTWIVEHFDRGPFNIIWYTSGALVPATLKQVRESYPSYNLRSVTQLFLFPGRVDPQTEAVSGDEAAEFVNKLGRQFTYSFLSANSFDIAKGVFYFHYKDEIALQRACATRPAAHKFLFFDPTKFRKEGEPGYEFGELLQTADSVSIYTVTSEKDEWIKNKFDELCGRVLRDCHELAAPRNNAELDMKTIRLQIVGSSNTSSFSKINVGHHVL
jgi:hypothetical protein